MKELVIATNNPGKIVEIQSIFSSWHCIPQGQLGIDSADETGLSFIENAIIKARHASRKLNKPALADDSGLVVEALKGEPGIYSARYAGFKATDQENVALLLKKLAETQDHHRKAYFYCALAFVQHADDPTPIVATGKLEGKIADEPRGENGFGYDPIFFLPLHQCTVAELSPDLKNTISHRALAFKALAPQLEN